MITICTPTYNRAYTLRRLFDSLMKQTNRNFEWLVIDDGSDDETELMLSEFKKHADFEIKYIYQINQGKHIALNKGIENANGELFTCLDSDDWLYKDAVEIISNEWEHYEKDLNIVGVIALNTYKNGDIVGKSLPKERKIANWIDMKYQKELVGDKDYYFRTSELKKVMFPSYKNNRHMPPTYQHYLLSEKFDFLLVNVPTKYVEYLEDGISKNKYNKYVIAPDNFARYRYEIMNLIPNYKNKIINAIHFNSSQYLGTIKIPIRGFFNKIIVLSTKPLGYLLSIYIKKKINRNKNISHRIEDEA